MTLSKLDLFFTKVEVASNGCWQWTGSFYGNGYAIFSVKSRTETKGNRMGLAHRWAYRMLKGEIPDSLELDHLCRNRGCVNPDHLEAVTHQENGLRAKALITQCSKGHSLDGVRRYGRGASTARYCLTCNRERYYKSKELTGSAA